MTRFLLRAVRTSPVRATQGSVIESRALALGRGPIPSSTIARTQPKVTPIFSQGTREITNNFRSSAAKRDRFEREVSDCGAGNLSEFFRWILLSTQRGTSTSTQTQGCREVRHRRRLRRVNIDTPTARIVGPA
jgi:hypothetical protein